MNVGNYSKQQIQRDATEKIWISEAIEKYLSRKASDYNRNPSDIKLKSRSNRAVVFIYLYA